MAHLSIRLATANDLPAINSIYNYYVIHSTCTYQTEPSTEKERAEWFEGARRKLSGYGRRAGWKGGFLGFDLTLPPAQPIGPPWKTRSMCKTIYLGKASAARFWRI